MDLKSFVKDIPDFPKPGITFKDICPLLNNPKATETAVNELAALAKNKNITRVVGIESRGFFLGILLAQKLGVGFVPMRKPGKLPGKLLSQTYDLEYGQDALEIQKNSLAQGEKILLHDDVLATGGTAQAACKIIEKTGAQIVQCSFLMELTFLNGKDRLKNYEVASLLSY